MSVTVSAVRVTTWDCPDCETVNYCEYDKTDVPCEAVCEECGTVVVIALIANYQP